VIIINRFLLRPLKQVLLCIANYLSVSFFNGLVHLPKIQACFRPFTICTKFFHLLHLNTTDRDEINNYCTGTTFDDIMCAYTQ